MSKNSRKTLTLIGSLLLPVLLLGTVALLEWYAKTNVADPQFDALFSIQPYPNRADCPKSKLMPEASSKGDQVAIRFVSFTYERCKQLPRFFRYRVSTGTNEEIPVSL